MLEFNKCYIQKTACESRRLKHVCSLRRRRRKLSFRRFYMLKSPFALGAAVGTTGTASEAVTTPPSAYTVLSSDVHTCSQSKLQPEPLVQSALTSALVHSLAEPARQMASASA